MADASEETRLDQLWQAVAESDAEADWVRFYEGFAAARLIVPLAKTAEGEPARPLTLALDAGEVALAFDTEARFTAFITEPTEFVALTGVMLAGLLAENGISVALNPGVSAAETMLDPVMLGWVATHGGADVTFEPVAGPAEIGPPPAPEEALLEALGRRFEEMAGAVAEAWLLGNGAADGCAAFLCVLVVAPEAEALADEIAGEITRLGQWRAERPFTVAVAAAEARLVQVARRFGIGLVVPSAP